MAVLRDRVLAYSLSLSFSLLLLSLVRRAISKNGAQDPTISRAVWFYVSTQSATACVCVGPKSDPRARYLTHSRCAVRASARTRVRDGARIVLVRAREHRVSAGARGNGVMEGNGTEKGSAPRRQIGPAPAPSPPFPPRAAALVHFLLSKIMTMLIFLTREEFFKLTCNQT